MTYKTDKGFIYLLVWLIIFQVCAPVVRVGPGSVLGRSGIGGETERLFQRASAGGTPEPGEKEQWQRGIQEAFAEMLVACKTALATFEHRAWSFRWLAFSIAIVGAVAGSIAVPALTTASASGNAAWIAAFGSVSGTTNTAQHLLHEQGWTSFEVRNRREGIRQEWNRALAAYFQAGSDNYPA